MTPYTAIGKFTVALVLTVSLEALVIALGVAVYVAWHRSLTWLSNLMWRGYSPEDGNYPPAWKLKISGTILAIRLLEFRKLPDVIEEAEEMADGGLDTFWDE